MIDTNALGASIEKADVAGMRACVASAQRVAKDLDARSIDILGGIAPFVGVSSPLSEACGLGIFSGEAGPDDVARLTAFYEERGTPARVLVSPLASTTFAPLLASTGYRPVENQNVLACEIAFVDCERDDRVSESRDPRSWGRQSAAGFTEPAECDPSEDAVLIGTIIASVPSVTILEARVNGTTVATAAMDVQGDLAGLFAGSTVASERKRGWHAALIRDRLARARDRGARFARTSAGVGSASERNFRRAGFQVLYTRTVWERAIANNYQRQYS
jgi:hypothetical protein